jgi:hypothetical protein
MAEKSNIDDLLAKCDVNLLREALKIGAEKHYNATALLLCISSHIVMGSSDEVVADWIEEAREEMQSKDAELHWHNVECFERAESAGGE